MRIMGLDYGSKTVGVAVSDALGLTAQGIEIVRRKSENKLRQTLARIEEIAKEYGVEKIVLGFPRRFLLLKLPWPVISSANHPPDSVLQSEPSKNLQTESLCMISV